MKKVILKFMFATLAITMFTVTLNAQVETRGIGTNDAYALYFDGRTCYAPENSVTSGGGVAFSKNGFDISANYSSTKVKIKGRLIPKGARVNVFPRNGGFYGDKVSIEYSNTKYANKANKKVFSNKNEECILIGYNNMYWYVPRRCLVQ
jgi:hypothetical protein